METARLCPGPGLMALTALMLAPSVARAQTYSFEVQPKLVNIAFESRMDV